MARKSCLLCVRKHLAQASILMDESHFGYPHHKWFAVGHLAEAESECRGKIPEFSKKIRIGRLLIMEDKGEPNFDDLIIEACRLNGEEIIFDENNSKKFEEEE